MAKARVKVPGKAKAGEVILIKTLIRHKMESGNRKDKKTGQKIPRHIIDKFTAKYNGEVFFSSDWEGGVSANPYCSFNCKVDKSGAFEFIWHDEKGEEFKAEAKIEVS
ncbi:MAG TPA: thiosulfate oxidation carrier complex protein SoxZ [Thermopetrobacter sp.]|nr:thiosulfate oxidation carrier complex protein SoxZ [Thermopetrobacter sp.]